MTNWELERGAWTPGETLPVPDLWPVAMLRLQRAQAAAGWLSAVTGGVDTGGSRWLTLDAVTRDRERAARVTWHSRATNGRSLRLFSAMLRRPHRGWHDVTVKALVVSTFDSTPAAG